jgi:hypothetical protein
LGWEKEWGALGATEEKVTNGFLGSRVWWPERSLQSVLSTSLSRVERRNSTDRHSQHRPAGVADLDDIGQTTMTLRTAIVALPALLLSGCLSPQKIVFVDQVAHAGPPTIREIRADGDKLRVTLTQDSAPAWVASVKARVIAGDVYLSTVHISSVVHATEFAVDMSGRKFPPDWRSRLYWIEGDSISSPVNPFIEHMRQIRRSKIILKD